LEFVQEKIFQYVVDVARGNLSLSDIDNLPAPFLPLDEQQLIVNEVGRRMSVVKESENEVEINFRRAEGLMQSILKKAFSGQLLK
jgi:type I restriction enzyme S subunit